MDTFLEIIDARTGDAKHTGIGAMFDSEETTRQAFESARPLHTAGGGFLLDLHIDGDLIDTIELTAAGVQLVSGVTPESPEYYVEYDKKEWQQAEAIYLTGLTPGKEAEQTAQLLNE